jgi:hypothetical protein
MKSLYFLLSCLVFVGITLPAQTNPKSEIRNPQSDAWKIVGENIDPANYYGITVANGMIGLVSSPTR